MKKDETQPSPAPEEPKSASPFQPTGPGETPQESPQPSARELELEQQLAEVRRQQQDGAKTIQQAAASNAKLRGEVAEANVRHNDLQMQLAKATTKPATGLDKAKAGFKVPEGEGDYTHVYVTHKNGVALPEPQVEPYHPNVWKQLSKSPNIVQGEVFHKGK